MTPQDFEICKKCGGWMKLASAGNTSPLITECQACGHREEGEVHFSPPWPPDEKGGEPIRVIVLREEGRARPEEIRALRKLDPHLGSLPMSEAAKIIGSSRSIDLGVHCLKDAQDLLKRAKTWGLKVRLEKPKEDPFPRQERQRLFESFGAPVSVGEPGEETTVIPFGWIVIGVALIIILLVWILL